MLHKKGRQRDQVLMMSCRARLALAGGSDIAPVMRYEASGAEWLAGLSTAWLHGNHD